TGEAEGRPRVSYLEVLDDQVLRHHGDPVREGHGRPADLDHTADAAVVVELGPRGRPVPVEDRPLSAWSEDTADGDGRRRCADARHDELLLVGGGPPPGDEHRVARVQRFPGNAADTREGLSVADLVRDSTCGRREAHGQEGEGRHCQRTNEGADLHGFPPTTYELFASGSRRGNA